MFKFLQQSKKTTKPRWPWCGNVKPCGLVFSRLDTLICEGRGGYPLVARWLALGVSFWTAVISLVLPMSAVARSLGDSLLADALNWGILLASLVGWADVIYHDFLGRLLFPSLYSYARHYACVMLYMGLGGLFTLRAFVVLYGTPSNLHETVVLASFYLTMAVGCALLSIVLAVEKRE